VGLNLRLFVVNATGKPEDDKVYVNPMLSDADGDEESEEGCLSLPDIKVNIRRPTVRVKMQAQDLEGKPFEEIGEGFITRIWQHENDHLNGVLITDRMGAVAKMAYRKKLKEMEDDFNGGK
jgi:peptide deformylase